MDKPEQRMTLKRYEKSLDLQPVETLTDLTREQLQAKIDEWVEEYEFVTIDIEGLPE